MVKRKPVIGVVTIPLSPGRINIIKFVAMVII